MNLTRVAATLFIVLAGVLLLVYGKHLMVPFLFALLLWFFVREIKLLLDRIRWIRSHVPSWIKTTTAFLAVFGVLGLAGRLLTDSIAGLAESYDAYRPNIDLILSRLESVSGVDVWETIRTQAGKLDFGVLFTALFNTLTDLLGNALLILFYAIFIFLEESHFHNKLRAVFPSRSRYDEIDSILRRAELAVSRYIGMKTLVSLLTGGLSYIVFLSTGLDAPVFWAFLIFFLNFIPTLGSIVATFFPAAFSVIQFGTFTPCILILLLVGTIQLIAGNVLEPRLLGNALNISPLVAILSLSFWGALWGITGMILSVPMTVILVTVFSYFPATRSVAVLLSEKGNLSP